MHDYTSNFDAVKYQVVLTAYRLLSYKVVSAEFKL